MSRAQLVNAADVFNRASTLSVISVSISAAKHGIDNRYRNRRPSRSWKQIDPQRLIREEPDNPRLMMIIVARTGRRTQISASFCIIGSVSSQVVSSQLVFGFGPLGFWPWGFMSWIPVS